jgi:hypothetical protein
VNGLVHMHLWMWKREDMTSSDLEALETPTSVLRQGLAHNGLGRRL